MNILVLNGSPRKHGNTAFMIEAFLDGAKQQGHHVDVISVCEKNINGCLACDVIQKETVPASSRMTCRKFILY